MCLYLIQAYLHVDVHMHGYVCAHTQEEDEQECMHMHVCMCPRKSQEHGKLISFLLPIQLRSFS